MQGTRPFGRSMWCAVLATAAGAAPAEPVAIAPAGLSPGASAVVSWVRGTADNGKLPYVVIDKVQARLLVFSPTGVLIGSSAVLLGSAPGDASVPGIGERELRAVLPHERTTPAGRFVLEAGRNLQGDDIIWVDYDAAVSMHRVRANNPAEQRLARLASATPLDNRISYGCINVPAAFYDQVLQRALPGGLGIAYIVPEHVPLQVALPQMR